MKSQRVFFASASAGIASGVLAGSKAFGQSESPSVIESVSQPLVVNARKLKPTWAMGIQVTVMVTSDQTGGAYSVFEDIIPPGSGPPPHTHYLCSLVAGYLEARFVADGKPVTCLH